MYECNDLLIGELIHKLGRLRQSDKASRQKVENQIRATTLESPEIFERSHKKYDIRCQVSKRRSKNNLSIATGEKTCDLDAST